MNTASVTYLGELRTQATHIRSGQAIITDAPVDNHGKGEAFSPTDLLTTALITCMITTMGIAAQGRGWDMGAVSGEVLKVMANNPRRVEKAIMSIEIRGNRLDAEQRHTLEQIGIHCPVARSLHPDLVVETEFKYVD
ncbi:MAG: OsmC family protein [Bacteroidia bacterium]